jgi:hypothetical protein
MMIGNILRLIRVMRFRDACLGWYRDRSLMYPIRSATIPSSMRLTAASILFAPGISRSALLAHLCSESTYGHDFGPALSDLQKIGPLLHHLCAGLQVESAVVGGADDIPGSVRELQLNMVMSIPSAHAGWSRPGRESHDRSLCP